MGSQCCLGLSVNQKWEHLREVCPSLSSRMRLAIDRTEVNGPEKETAWNSHWVGNKRVRGQEAHLGPWLGCYSAAIKVAGDLLLGCLRETRGRWRLC